MTVIEFSFQTKYGAFNDALIFADEVPSEAEIEAMKQERFANWLAIVEAPPEE